MVDRIARSTAPHPEPGRGRPAGAEGKRPYHLGVALGVSAGVYAASLSAVTLAQIETDRALLADRQPVADAIDVLRSHHDGMAVSLERARAVYDQATTRYGVVVKGVDALHSAVDRVGRWVAAIEGSAVSGSTGSIDLPPPPGKPSHGSTSGAAAPTAPPASNGTSGASGKP